MCWTPKGETYLNEREKEEKHSQGRNAICKVQRWTGAHQSLAPWVGTTWWAGGTGKVLNWVEQDKIKNLVYIILSGAMILII